MAKECGEIKRENQIKQEKNIVTLNRINDETHACT